MRWTRGNRDNIEDLRGASGGGRRLGGGGVVPLGIGGFIIVALLSMFTGVDFFSLLGGGSATTNAPVATTGRATGSAAEERTADMVDAVARDAQETWTRLLGSRYQETRVVLFRDSIQSACGFAESVTGPFYCPGDHKVYLDMSFFDELGQRFGAPGEFAQAYVLAHEIGHHVQSLTGAEARVRQLQRSDPANANQMSVRLELQADCYAGVWGHATRQAGRAAQGKVELDPGDAEQALRAAAAIGDDRLQRLGTGRVMPEKFTHGSSQQRVEWFTRGFESGDPRTCDTFGR